MELNNEKLKSTLIKQYSKLSYISEHVMMEKLASPDWWSKEEYRLKVQNTVAKIGLGIVFLASLIFFVIVITKDKTNIPIYSFIAIFFALFSVQGIYSSVSEREKSFELMKLVFGKDIV